MKCEKAVREIFPVARSLIAKKLTEVYGLSQTASAKMMGITQPAISQYKKNIRGNKAKALLDNARFVSIANDIAKGLSEGSIKPEHIDKEMCRFCRLFEP